MADNGQIRHDPMGGMPWFGNLEMTNGVDASRATPQFQNIYIRKNATQMSPSFTNAIRGIFVENLTPARSLSPTTAM